MKPITHNTSWSQWKSRTPVFKLSSYLIGVFVLVTGFTVINMGARALAQQNLPPSNPFASYADVFPGQPTTNLAERGFSCALDYHNQYEYCQLYPATGAFSQLSVAVSKDQISIISFTMRDSVLKAGDLIVLWGTPDVRGRSHTLHFFSNNRSITAFPVEPISQYSLFLPVQRVIITNLTT